jgi:hypothetical protein
VRAGAVRPCSSDRAGDARPHVRHSLAESDTNRHIHRRADRGDRRNRTRHAASRLAKCDGALLIAQIAVTIVLVVAAGLFIRTFAGLATRQTGVDKDAVLLVDVDTARASIAPNNRAAAYADVRRAILALPGVTNAATFGAPIIAGRDFSDEDRSDAPPAAVVNQTLARIALGAENRSAARSR